MKILRRPQEVPGQSELPAEQAIEQLDAGRVEVSGFRDSDEAKSAFDLLFQDFGNILAGS
jgi:hypothetical protein